MKPSILIADSCAGGLAVLKPFLEWAGDYNLIYLADGEKNPFGKKTKEEVSQIVKSWLDHFKNENLHALIVACNTASIAIFNICNSLEREYNLPIITMISGTEEVLKKNTLKITNKNIVLFGTRLTVNSPIYKNIIEKYKPKKFFCLEGTETERIVARGLLNSKEEKINLIKEVSKYKDNNINCFF